MEPLFFLELLKNTIALALGIFVETVYAIELPSIKEGQNLGEFIVSIYNLAIGLVGFAVFIQFIRAGLTYLFAAGNMAEIGNARTMMQNAVLGAVLLLSSYLILNVINPDLLNVNIFDLECIKQQIKGASCP